MSSSAIKLEARAVEVTVTADTLRVRLADGRELAVPVAWFPRLQQASADVRNRCRLIGGGVGIHWPDLDEDFGIEGLLLGKPSSESPGSFERWLKRRTEELQKDAA